MKKMLQGIFLLLSMFAIASATSSLGPDQQTPISLSLTNTATSNVQYSFSMPVTVDIPKRTYFLITFPFAPGTIDATTCQISTLPGTIYKDFDPAIAFTPAAPSTLSILNCYTNNSTDTTVKLQISSAISISSIVKIVLTVPNGFPQPNSTSQQIQPISIEIASSTASNRYSYAKNNYFDFIAYQNSPSNFSGTFQASMQARNKYDNAIDLILNFVILPLSMLYDNQSSSVRSNFVPYTQVSQLRTAYANLYPNDVDFVKNTGFGIVDASLLPSQSGFEGTLQLQFNLGSTALPSLTLLDFTLPADWTSTSQTKCYFANPNGETLVNQTSCETPDGVYFYMVLRQAVPASSLLNLQVTHIQNPQAGISTGETIALRIMNPNSFALIYAGTSTGLTTTAASLYKFTVIPANQLSTNIFSGVQQYLSAQIASYSTISSSSAIILTITSSGFIPGRLCHQVWSY